MHFPTTIAVGRWLGEPQSRSLGETNAQTVSLLRWLRRQLREPFDGREHLEAAVADGNVDEARRLLARFELTEVQRRHLEGLLDAWDASMR